MLAQVITLGFYLALARLLTPEDFGQFAAAAVDQADIVVENYKVGALKKYGLDYESLAKINPLLIYCSISGFGQTGPRAGEAYDWGRVSSARLAQDSAASATAAASFRAARMSRCQ